MVGLALFILSTVTPSYAPLRRASDARLDKWLYVGALLLLAVEVMVIFTTWPENPVTLFNGMMRVDNFSSFLKLLFVAGAALTLLMGGPRHGMERLLLVFSTTLGANLLVMSNNLVMVVIAIELISISSYVLAAGPTPDKTRSEAAWKFFLFGSVATAVMIFGMSYLYGLTGTLDFASTQLLQMTRAGSSPIVYVAGLMTLAGMLFKMTAVPFHLWAPDVFESTETPVVAFFSVVPKLAGLGVVIKFALALHLFGQSQVDWSLVLAVIAMLSILVGNLSALAQTDARRMMAWSSVAQAGFLLAAVSTFSIEGVQVTLFYATTFLLMNYATFIFIQQVEEGGFARRGVGAVGSVSMPSIAGWGYVITTSSVLVTIALISLTGLPPTAGFTAKLLVFSAIWEKFKATGNGVFLSLFIVGLINTVISLFFYLRIPYYLFVKPLHEPNAIKINPFQNLLAMILVTLLLILFFYPALLMGWLNKVNFVL